MYKITHRPDLSYKKYYYSEKSFIQSEIIEEPQIIEDENIEESIKDLIDSVENSISLFPDPIKDIINDLTDKIKDKIDEIKYKDIDDITEENDRNNNNKENNNDNDKNDNDNNFNNNNKDNNDDNEYNKDEDNNDSDDSNSNYDDDGGNDNYNWDDDYNIDNKYPYNDIDVPENPFYDTVIDINIKPKDEINIIEKIEKDYKQDLLAIIEDYLKFLNMTVSKNLTNILLSLGYCDDITLILKKYKEKTSKISKDNRHLSDKLITNDIERSQNEKLLKKLYNNRQTDFILRSCSAYKDLRKRYYKANVKQTKNYLDESSNKLLERQRAKYDKKYKDTMYNLYKYLNSSVILIDDQLKLYTEEIQSKVNLINSKELEVKESSEKQEETKTDKEESKTDNKETGGNK